jgi:hypothetical protein
MLHLVCRFSAIAAMQMLVQLALIRFPSSAQQSAEEVLRKRFAQ